MKNKKTALIVGGGKYLGGYLSKNLSTDYNIIIVDKDIESAQQTAKKISEETQVFEADVSDEKKVIAIFNEIEKKNISIDLLVYVAGFAKADKITDQKKEDFQISLDVNLIGYATFAKHTAKNMIKNNVGGVIININSKVGKIGSKRQSGYSSAKFGAVGLTQSMALDLAQHNIRVNSLMLGHLLDSEMFTSLIPSKAKALNIKPEEVKQHYINLIPLRRGCAYKDVYNVLHFYASEKASYITGQSINITGGQIMW